MEAGGFTIGDRSTKAWLSSPVHQDLADVDFEEDKDAWKKVREIVKNIKNEEVTASFIGPGDSGGPLICTLKNGRTAVIGIASHVEILGRLGISNGPNFDWYAQIYFFPVKLKLLEKNEIEIQRLQRERPEFRDVLSFNE